MNLIKTIISNYKEKLKIENEKCNNLVIKLDNKLQEINALFSNFEIFIDPIKENEWKNEFELIFLDVNIRSLKRTTQYKNLLSKKNEFDNILDKFKENIDIHNNRVADAKIDNAYTLIGDIEGRKLDKQQMSSIVKDFHNHLVIAGAGTGKTTTIIGKIKYLINTKKSLPDEILVLSFTNSSAKEMDKRIKSETGYNIDASTFHKLGLNIITEVEGKKPRITQLNLYNFVKEQLLINIESNDYLNLLISYILYNHVSLKSEFDFKSQAEYDEYLKFNPPTTINNETVKSYGEMDIANFLTQNSIKYVYEAPYKVDTRTDKYGQYYPDFYLPEYNIYIEYFGIDENGDVPSYFKGRDNLSATDAYQKSMSWKREIHNLNNTTLIECYAYELFDGNLLDNLKEKLIKNNVTLTLKDSKELWNMISNKNGFNLDGIVELFETIINLMKSNKYTTDDLQKLNVKNKNIKNNNIIISLISPIYDAYNNYLIEHEEIDFNDMINIATKYIQEKKYKHHYKYVIVDEYQDISKSRFLLLDSMRKSSDYNIFCVGDDWQSIYRFTGSDISYILNFQKYWGPAEISKIETTYRFNQKLIEISSNFIMKNPIQIKKDIKGKSNINGFPLSEISGYTNEYAIKFMAKKIEDLEKNSSVFFIGRYTFDIKLLSESGMFDCKYDKINELTSVKYFKRPDLKMNYITAHKSKGLQADYVFIINNKKSKMGFPSKIQDAPILNLLLESREEYPYAEERRLFYVALTRAKKKVFLLTLSNQESEFAIELRKQYEEKLKNEKWECPICGGKLVIKNGPYGKFIGCSNYTSGCKYKKKINNN